ncbi:MAG TPA: sugar transferase [Pyrinomonadaceae bacterium]|nr:sugar transferase [Pyrinomonadaceae bacterium]
MKTETTIEYKTELVRAADRVPRWVMPLVKTVIFLADALLAAVCFMTAFAWREGEAIFADASSLQFSREFAPYAAVLALAVPVRLSMLLYQRVYRAHGAFSYTREAIKIFKAVSVGSLLVVAIAFMFRGGFEFRNFSYSRGVFLLDFVLALVSFTAFHLTLRYVQTLFRQRDINLIPTLIVGHGAETEQTIRELQSRPDLGYRVVGIVETSDFAGAARRQSEEANKNFVPTVGKISNLPSLIKQLAIQEVIITDNTLSQEILFEAMMKIGRRQRVEFRVAPTLFNVLPQKTEVEQIGVLPMVRLFREPLSDVERVIKRISDIAIATIALVLLAPLWIVLAILIRLDSRGPIVFRQERVGMDGRIFLCFKFRTMREDADENLHREAYRKNIAGKAEANAGDADEPVFGKVKDDPRITRIGRWLRRSSLDELPQILNVLTGDMSVVGARPPIPYEVEEYALWQRRRLDMKPGITGLWQVSGRNRLTFEEMVKLDLYYIENWSLWLDLKIILMTIPAVLRGDGAR